MRRTLRPSAWMTSASSSRMTAIRRSEIDGTDGFAEAVSGFGEVLVAHGRAFVRKPLTETEKAALCCSGRLIAKFAVANARKVHEPRELARSTIDVELLKSEKIRILHFGLLPRQEAEMKDETSPIHDAPRA